MTEQLSTLPGNTINEPTKFDLFGFQDQHKLFWYFFETFWVTQVTCRCCSSLQVRLLKGEFVNLNEDSTSLQ